MVETGGVNGVRGENRQCESPQKHGVDFLMVQKIREKGGCKNLTDTDGGSNK